MRRFVRLNASFAVTITSTTYARTKSSFAKVTGDVYVRYRLDSVRSATIHGMVRNATSGEDLRLYAQQFPYQKAPAELAHVAIGAVTTTCGQPAGVQGKEDQRA